MRNVTEPHMEQMGMKIIDCFDARFQQQPDGDHDYLPAYFTFHYFGWTITEVQEFVLRRIGIYFAVFVR